MQLLHQSHVEIEHYFVVYFDIAAFKTLKRKTSIKGGTHMHYIDLSGIHALWALPLTEVLHYSFERSNAVKLHNGMFDFYLGLPH